MEVSTKTHHVLCPSNSLKAWTDLHPDIFLFPDKISVDLTQCFVNSFTVTHCGTQFTSIYNWKPEVYKIIFTFSVCAALTVMKIWSQPSIRSPLTVWKSLVYLTHFLGLRLNRKLKPQFPVSFFNANHNLDKAFRVKWPRN